MRLLLIISCFISIFIPSLSASSSGNGYKIEVELQHYTGDSLFLGYYFGKSQYLKDTAIVSKGKFVFQGDEKLAPGLYLLVIPPENRFVHVLISDDQQRFSVTVDTCKMASPAKFNGRSWTDISTT